MESGVYMSEFFRGQTALVVDDDAASLLAISEAIEYLGFESITAQSGPEALDVLNNPGTVINVILMDLYMPKLNGMDASRVIKTNNRLAHMPIIAVTAMPNFRDEALKSGIDEFVTKPVDIDELAAALERQLRQDFFVPTHHSQKLGHLLSNIRPGEN